MGVRLGYIHLRVEEASGRLDDADSLVVDRDSVEGVLAVLQHSNELQAEVLGVEFGGEGVGNRLLGAGWDLKRITLGGEVANNLALASRLLDQRATDNGDANGSGFIVGDGEAGLGGMAVDELDAEDLRLREGDGDGDVEVGGLGRVVGFCDLLDLQHAPC